MRVDTPGGGAQSDARDQLWQRLLDGELTRVAVACSTQSAEIYKKYIPHSLGLERVWPYAHQQDRKTGAYRTRAEMDRIAEDLAAQDGWICGSGWPSWDAFFVKSADAVLVFQTPSRAWRIRLVAARSSTASTIAAVFRALLRRQPRYDDGPFLSRRIHGPRRGYYSWAGQYALDSFPEKTFLINHHEDLKKLRAVG